MKKTIVAALLLAFSLWALSASVVNFAYGRNVFTSPFALLGIENHWPAKQYFDGGIGFSDGSTQNTAAGVSASPIPTHISSTYHALLQSSGWLKVVGKYAYQASLSSDTFHIWDVSNAASPYHISSLTSGVSLNGIEGMDIVGDLAFVSCMGDHVTVIDHSNKSAPFIAGHVDDATYLDGAEDLVVVGKYAYVAAYNQYSPNPGMMTVVDISDYTNPTVAGYVTGVTMAKLIYLQARDNYIYGSSASGFTIFDISEPTKPVIAGSTAYGTSHIGSVIDGAYVYVSVGSKIRVYDVSNPTRPYQVAQTATLPNSALVLRKAGNYIYYTHAFGGVSSYVGVVDVSNPLNPFSIGGLSQEAGVSKFAWADDIYIQGKYIYTTGNASRTLDIFEIQNLTLPGIHGGSAYFDNVGVAHDLRTQGQIYAGTAVNVGPGGVYSPKGPLTGVTADIKWVKFRDGTTMTTAATGSGGGTPGGPDKSVQYNNSGSMNGTGVLKIDTSSGSTVFATYYASGQTAFMQDATGVTVYDAAGNVMWGTIGGYNISYIDITGAIATKSGVSGLGGVTAPYFFGDGSKLTGVATTVDLTKGDRARTGVSSMSQKQIVSGSSLFPTNVFGAIMYINSSDFTNIRLPELGSGSTEYAGFVVIGSGGVSITTTAGQRFFRKGSANNGASALYIPPGSYLEELVIFGVTGFQVDGVTGFYRYRATSGVSEL